METKLLFPLKEIFQFNSVIKILKRRSRVMKHLLKGTRKELIKSFIQHIFNKRLNRFQNYI